MKSTRTASTLCVAEPAPPPQTLGVPSPPQSCGAMQLPQSMVRPQPSGIVPQFLFCSTQLLGVHPQWFGTPPPPQVCRPAQEPQLAIVPAQPSAAGPQSCPLGQETTRA